MHGELAELIALAAYGNAFLHDGGAAPELFPDHSTFRYVRAVEFVRVSRLLGILPQEQPVAAGTASWLENLRARGATQLELVRSSRAGRKRQLLPHIEVGFSNGLDVALLARSPRAAELWTGTWRVESHDHPEQRIWLVRYRGEEIAGSSSKPVNLDAAAERLGGALHAAREVALDASWPEWADVFQAAAAELVSDAPTIRYHPDLLPASGYGLRARQTLAAVSAGWVLGGMGSWNDVAPPDEARYATVTAELHAALIDAAVAAASWRPARA